MTTALHTFSSQIIGVSDRDINVNSEATQIRDLDVAKASYSDDVRITTAKLCGLTWFQVYVRGVLACEAMPAPVTTSKSCLVFEPGSQTCEGDLCLALTSIS
jgi:hypothetical protein